MCNVCDAEKLVKGLTVKTRSLLTGNFYEIRATAEKPEGEPCIYELRRNGGKWTDGVGSQEELAIIVEYGGFDLRQKSRTAEHDAWLEKHFFNIETMVDVSVIKPIKIMSSLLPGNYSETVYDKGSFYQIACKNLDEHYIDSGDGHGWEAFCQKVHEEFQDNVIEIYCLDSHSAYFNIYLRKN